MWRTKTSCICSILVCIVWSISADITVVKLSVCFFKIKNICLHDAFQTCSCKGIMVYTETRCNMKHWPAQSRSRKIGLCTQNYINSSFSSCWLKRDEILYLAYDYALFCVHNLSRVENSQPRRCQSGFVIYCSYGHFFFYKHYSFYTSIMQSR